VGFNHVAIATRNLDAAHQFYTEAMGFRLVHVEAGDAPEGDAWFRHVFYDTGDGSLLALFQLHGDRYDGLDLAISRGLGLPNWVNHIAYGVDDLHALDAAQDRWLANGFDVMRVEHGIVTSIYTDDPDGNFIEFSCWVKPLDAATAQRAELLLRDPNPPRTTPVNVEFFSARGESTPAGVGRAAPAGLFIRSDGSIVAAEPLEAT
jgi:catechol 2,3-dioxygenase-like lactoylglutathione lyase family enzyme